MTREEQIISFLNSLRKWVAEQGERLLVLLEEDREDEVEAMEILAKVERSMDIASLFYDEWHIVTDENDNLKYNFLQEDDSEIEKMISDYSYCLGINLQPYGAFPLLNINIFEPAPQSTQLSDIPPGGGIGYVLSKDSSGNLIWIKEDVVQDNLIL